MKQVDEEILLKFHGTAAVSRMFFLVQLRQRSFLN